MSGNTEQPTQDDQPSVQEMFNRVWALMEQVRAHPDYASTEWRVTGTDRLVIPVGLLEALTARLDALEARLVALEQAPPRSTVVHPTGTPPQPIVIVTYPEDSLGE